MAGRRNLPKQQKYGLLWEPLMVDAAIEMQMIRQGGTYKGHGNGLFFHFKAFISLLWPEHVWHRWNELELDSYLKYRIIGEMGPASCVAGHTRILNPITGEQPTILELYESGISPIVMTMEGPAVASVPFIKGVDDLYEVTLEDGQRFTATAGHRILTSEGFVSVGDVESTSGGFLLGYAFCHPQSTLEPFQSVPTSNALSSLRTTEDSRFCCQRDPCSYGEPLRRAEDSGQSFSPLQVDVLKCNGLLTEPRKDGLGDRSTRTRPYQSLGPLSMPRTSQLFDCKEIVDLLPLFSENFSDVCDCFRTASPPQSKSFRPESFSKHQNGLGRTLQSHASCEYHRVQRVAVASIKRVGVGIFFDLKVPGPNHYFAEGAIHHNSGKTHSAAINVLADYYPWSDCTTVLVSSTEREMLEMRVWGEIKKYHRMAQDRFPHLIPGNLIESRQRIITDSRFENADGRDFRNGICGVPCKKGGSYVGLGSFAGIKNKRLRMVADECHLMNRVFVDAIANLNKNADFKCVALGNPKDTTDALGVICEPAAHIGGWDGGIDQSPKTKTWPTRFDQGVCVQLVGSDSPNLNGQLGIPIIDQKSIDADIAFYGRDSLQFTMMDEGRMPRGQGLRRVITRQMCLKFGAMEEAIWKNDKRMKIGFLDAAYGSVGGDRCVYGELQFGLDPNDRQILELIPGRTMLVPVSVEVNELPEDQIANFVKAQCEQSGIPPQQFGFDSTGRGTLMGAFGRIWSPHVVPIEFGGKPSERQVTWIPNAVKMTCRDYYSKFVSELWYSVALTVQSQQFRGMTEEMMNEGCMREWGIVGANKIEVEPKEKMKLKTGRSPDLFDALVSGVEMARRFGFVISMIVAKGALKIDDGWKQKFKDRMSRLESNHRLTY